MLRGVFNMIENTLGPVPHGLIRRAVVRATATGAAVAAPRPYFTFVAVSGEADDRTFVLAAQRLARFPLDVTSVPATRFYLLRINPAAATVGERATLTTALPMPVEPKGIELDGMAVSPDGSKLAVTSTSNITPGVAHARLHVFDMTTGAGRTWAVSLPDGRSRAGCSSRTAQRWASFSR